jgi:hypothetical protein
MPSVYKNILRIAKHKSKGSCSAASLAEQIFSWSIAAIGFTTGLKGAKIHGQEIR